MKRKTKKIKNFLKNILFLFWLKNIFRIREVRKKRKRNDLRLLKRSLQRHLIKGQSLSIKDETALEEKIYWLLRKYFKLSGERSTNTAWLFIEGMIILPEEGMLIKEIWAKKGH